MEDIALKENLMTIKEVATALGVSESLVKKRVRELRYDHDALKNSQGGYLLNEEQVTTIKLRIQENSSLAPSDDRTKLQNMPKTKLEKQLLIKQAMQLQDEMISDLQLELEKSQKQVENQAKVITKQTKKIQHQNEVIVDITENVPTKTMRTMVRKMVNHGSNDFKGRWMLLYKEFELRYSVNILLRAKNRGMNNLDYVEDFGYMRDLYELSVELFEKEYNNIKHKFLATIQRNTDDNFDVNNLWED